MNELTRAPCRTALIDAHTNAITASDTTADRKHLATVSLDSMLKVSLKQNTFNFHFKNKLLVFWCLCFCLFFHVILNSVIFQFLGYVYLRKDYKPLL